MYIITINIGKLPHGRGICKLKRAYAGGKLKQSLLQIAACEKLKHVKSSRNAPKDSTVVDIQTGSMVGNDNKLTV